MPNPRYQPLPLTAEDIREYREATGASMMEAKALLRDQRLALVLVDLQASGSVEDKVDFLLAQFAEKLDKRLTRR